MNRLHSVLIIAVIALVTMLIRFSPFIIFRKKLPLAIRKLGSVLPQAVIGMLVVYCLKDTGFSSYSLWLPQLAGVAVTVVAHKLKHNTLLSIVLGTASYMILLRI